MSAEERHIPSSEAQQMHGESAPQSGEGERTVLSVLTKGFADADLKDVEYLLVEMEGGRIGSSDLPLAARTCSFVIGREKAAGNDVTAYENRLPREALGDFWTARLQRDLPSITSLLDSEDVSEAYRKLVDFFERLNQAETDGINTAKIREDFKREVSGSLLRAFSRIRKKPTKDSINALIGIYQLASGRRELFDNIGVGEIGYLQAIQKELESKES